MNTLRDFKCKFNNFNAFEKIIVINIIIFISGQLIGVFVQTSNSLSFVLHIKNVIEFVSPKNGT